MRLITPYLFALFAVLFTFASAAPQSSQLEKRYPTPVLYPRAGTIWRANSPHNVTWSLRFAPAPPPVPCARRLKVRAPSDTVTVAYLRNGAFAGTAASNAETDLGRVSVVAPGTPGYYSVRLTHSDGVQNFGETFRVVP